MEVRYIYKPEKRDIYLWNGEAVCLEDSSYGHTCITDIKGNYIDVFGDYSHEIEEIEKSPMVGKVIRPRWDKEEKDWRWRQGGCRYEEVIRNRQS